MKKRIFAMMLVMMLCLSSIPLNVLADEFVSDDGSGDQMITEVVEKTDSETTVKETKKTEQKAAAAAKKARKAEKKAERKAKKAEKAAAKKASKKAALKEAVSKETVTLTKVYKYEACEDEVTVEVAKAPADAELVVKEASRETYEDTIKEECGSDYAMYMALDISLKTKDEGALENKVKVSVKFDDFKKLPEGTVLYHIKGNKAEKVKFTLKKKKGIIHFKTKEFSPFVLVIPAEAEKADESEVAAEAEVKEEPEVLPETPEVTPEVKEDPAEKADDPVVVPEKTTEVKDDPAVVPEKPTEVKDDPADSKREETTEPKTPETEPDDPEKKDPETTEPEVKEPAPVSVQFSGRKIFDHFPADSKVVPEFTITLSEDGSEIDKKTIEKQGEYIFKEITYTEEGVHTYTIKEKVGKQAGVTYDEKIYTLTVNVVDNKEGQLVATITGDSTTGKDLDFTNTYKPAPISVKFSGTKKLKGKALAAKEFSFTLKAANEAAGDTKETVKNDADGKISFTKLTYTKPGVYKYTVKEAESKEAGVTSDEKVYKITVTVTDDGKGKLKAKISGDSKTGKDLKFVNVFETGSLTISKKVTGDLADKNKYFTFTITLDVDGKYSYKGSQTGTIASGESIKLKDGESITISGIPAKVSYKVVESDNADYTVTKAGDTGTIVANKEVKATFTNTKSSVPKTGDENNLSMWIGLMIISILFIAGTVLYGMKKRK